VEVGGAAAGWGGGLHLPARRGGRRRSRRVGRWTSSPRSPGRSAAKPPGGEVRRPTTAKPD